MRGLASRCTVALCPRTWWCLAVVVGLLLGTGAHARAQTFTDPQFVTELVATLDQFTPVGLAFAPDGRIFVWQKPGVVRIVKDGALLSAPFLDIQSRVNQCGDRGLLGLALDPAFPTNGFVYLFYTFESGTNPNDCNAKTSRLTRVTANPANLDVALPGSEVVIISGIPTDGDSHSVGMLRFAPDGKLFASHGDGASYSFADPLALRAQDLNSYNGKILRINPDGSAPGGNPFDDGTNSIRSKVWAYGLRNPFRFELHPATAEPYIGDVGWNTWEELNRGRGANFGWPCFEGSGSQPEYQAAFQQCRNLSPASVTPPFFTYNHTVGSTVIGGAFYTGSSTRRRTVATSSSATTAAAGSRAWSSTPTTTVTAVNTFATDVDGPVAIQMGPDGMLYYAAILSGEIRRIRFVGQARPPTAQAAAAPSAGYSPLTVHFSSAGSTNPGGAAHLPVGVRGWRDLDRRQPGAHLHHQERHRVLRAPHRDGGLRDDGLGHHRGHRRQPVAGGHDRDTARTARSSIPATPSPTRAPAPTPTTAPCRPPRSAGSCCCTTTSTCTCTRPAPAPAAASP